MGSLKSFKAKNQTLAFQQNRLVVGRVVLAHVNDVTVKGDNTLKMDGLTNEEETVSLFDIDAKAFLNSLSSLRKKFPNEPLLSQYLGMTQFAIAESFIGAENGKALVRFQESVNALERSFDQAPKVSATAVHLILSYCYLEELMIDIGQDASEDFSELSNELLLQLPEAILSQCAQACALRGERYFSGELSPLGFNFYKQEFFIKRQLQLMHPQNQQLWGDLENTGKTLASRCKEKGWKNIADQINQSIGRWQSDSLSSTEENEIDPRLADLAELEREGRAYLSHNNLNAALEPMEKHTVLIKAIYEDNRLDYYYGKLLLESYEQIIDIYQRLDQPTLGDEKLGEMVAYIEELRMEHEGDEYLANLLASSYEAVAERKLEQEDLTEAISLYKASLSLSESLASMNTDFQYYRHYQLETLKKLIELSERTGAIEMVSELSKKAITLKARLTH